MIKILSGLCTPHYQRFLVMNRLKRHLYSFYVNNFAAIMKSIHSAGLNIKELNGKQLSMRSSLWRNDQDLSNICMRANLHNHLPKAEDRTNFQWFWNEMFSRHIGVLILLSVQYIVFFSSSKIIFNRCKIGYNSGITCRFSKRYT